MLRASLTILICLLTPCVFKATVLTASIPVACDDKSDLGSATAKGGFRNENEIRDKFNNWETDKDSPAWLEVMGHQLSQIQNLTASKPHGYKADVEIVIATKSQKVTTQRLSIKLVSSPRGFNQIDKRWLKTYAQLWNMPPGVISGMKLYLGESPPNGPSRRQDRMYLDELPRSQRDAIIEFFRAHKDDIVSDLIAGDGDHAANWFMVTQKATNKPRWIIRPTPQVVKFFSEGPVQMTRAGNLKIGRVSMQRKGGDNGRDTAKMLQFKMNPALIFPDNK